MPAFKSNNLIVLPSRTDFPCFRCQTRRRLADAYAGLLITLFCCDRYKMRSIIFTDGCLVQPMQPDDGQATVARPRAFDHEKALDAAVDCFWSRGLGATSVRDLANGMGINGPSLYNAFGDKRKLFVQALERYADRSMRSLIQHLERDHQPADRISKFLGTLIEKSLADPDHRGCLIVNSALEVAPDDAEIKHLIASYLGEIEAFFRRCLDRGRADGVISATIDAPDAARLLLGVVLGIRVAARFRPERALLEGMVRPVLGLLDPPVQRKPAVKRRSRPVITSA